MKCTPPMLGLVGSARRSQRAWSAAQEIIFLMKLNRNPTQGNKTIIIAKLEENETQTTKVMLHENKFSKIG